MTIELRLFLVAGALVALIFFLYQIRKSRLQIGYAISWGLFSVIILIIAIFPDLITKPSRLLGFESPANMVFVLVIFVLFTKLFTTTMRLSKLDRQVADLAQHIAICEAENGPGMPTPPEEAAVPTKE